MDRQTRTDSQVGVHARLSWVPNEMEFTAVIFIVLINAFEVELGEEVNETCGRKGRIDDRFGDREYNSVDEGNGGPHGGRKQARKLGALVTRSQISQAAEKTGRITKW